MSLSHYPLSRIVAACILLLTVSVAFAQAPQMLNYQTVVRGTNGQPVANSTPVKLRFTIHDNTSTGPTAFSEVISTTANQFGLVSVQIGSNSNLAVVNWGNGAKYLQVEVDINNAGIYIDMGASQLISVPYALYAQNSNPGPIGPQGIAGPSGVNGATGAQGPTGVGIVNIVDNGNGTSTIFASDGSTFTINSQGPAGNNGVTGPQGPTGADGVTGPQGAAGTNGAQGPQGPTGAAGITGPQGVAGTNGAQGPQGPTGPTGPAGNANSWQLVDFSDFQNGTDNWNVTSGSMARGTFANVGTASGNYIYYMTGTSNTAITKTIDLTNYPHTYVMVKFTYWFIDSWDAGVDHGQCSISSDDVTYTSIWTKYGWTSLGTANLIQQTSSSYNDYYVKEDAISPHTGNTLYVRFNALGIGNANDESFGVDDIEVYVR